VILLFEPLPTYSFFAVGTGQQRLGPVVVDGAWQVAQLDARIGHARLAGGIAVFHDVAGISHIQSIADQLDAERGMEFLDVDELLPLATGARFLAQQRDTVAALAAFTRVAFDHACNDLLRRGDGLFARAISFDYQHVLVWQHQHLARVQQTGSDLFDLQASCHGWCGICRPAHAFRDLHRRHQEILCPRQGRIGTDLQCRIDFGFFATSAQYQRQAGGHTQCARPTLITLVHDSIPCK